MTTQAAIHPMVPQHLQQTLEWLEGIDDVETCSRLVSAVMRFLPPDDPRSWDFCAHWLFRVKSYERAAEAAVKTLALAPHSPEAGFNALKCFVRAARLPEAEQLARSLLAKRPQWMDVVLELALCTSLQGRFDDAETMLRDGLSRLLADDAHAGAIRFNLGWHELRRGRFKSGMRQLASGRALRIWGSSQRFLAPVLTPGADVDGKVVLIHGEGGIGDELINIRFAALLKARGARVAWQTQRPIETLLRRCPGVDVVLPPAAARDFPHDFCASAMDLPVLLDLDSNEIPSAPYLDVDPRFSDKWAAKAARSSASRGPTLRVGLRWQGNPRYEQDLMRSVPFASLEALCTIPGVELYSLQRDHGAEERSADSPVTDWGSELSTWEDTAAALSQLDLVISSCTAVAHLAAALGRPTWLLCPLNCYYLWAMPGDRSPWYQTLRLFRQVRPGSWEEPLRRIRMELANWQEAQDRTNTGVL
jgi:hypothetical protein